MSKLVLCLIFSLTLAVAWARPGDSRERGRGKGRWEDEERWDDWEDEDYGRGPPPKDRHRGRRPPAFDRDMSEFMGQMMRQMKGSMLDFIGAEMYGDHIFKKMTVILTADQQQKYSKCAKDAIEVMKAHKDDELRPMEIQFLLDRALGICMLKARFNYDNDKVDKLECCSIRAYFHEMINVGRRHGPKSKHIRTPPGFRMIEAEFGCFMNLTYGFSILDLKDLKKCMMEKEGVTDESTAHKLLAMLKGEDVEEDGKKGPHIPNEADVEACLMKVKPDMKAEDAKDVAFVNTKKRELAKAKSEAEEAKVDAAKRLLSLLEKANR